jgi:DNA-binding PadR family transcriptional regulator
MEPRQIRVTVAVATVVRAFLEQVDVPRYGYELMRVTGYDSGKLYPILARLEAAGWLTREREEVDPTAIGRPVRYWYRLTGDAVPLARLELATLHQQTRVSYRPTVVQGGEA